MFCIPAKQQGILSLSLLFVLVSVRETNTMETQSTKSKKEDKVCHYSSLGRANDPNRCIKNASR